MKNSTNTNRGPLDVYGIFFAGRKEQITARTVRAELVKLGTPEALQSVASIDRLCEKGERYSNQGFDVLSNATTVLARAGVSV